LKIANLIEAPLQVFKGLLDDKTVVAIKWLNFKSKEDMNEYRTQLEVLSKLRHRHLVSVLGYCTEEVVNFVEGEEFKSFRLFIVSEFMAKATSGVSWQVSSLTL